MNKINHIPVLLKETIDFLGPKPGGKFIDCTLGLGGHSRRILERISPDGELLALEVDEQVLTQSQKELSRFKDKVFFINDNFRNLKNVAYSHNFLKIDGILLDLGVSSTQLEDAARGFSFRKDGPLDMRMSKKQEVKASDLVNNLKEEELARIFYEYGEERFSRVIAYRIVKEREKKLILRTLELAEIISKAILPKVRFKMKIHPATRVFQALRIAVNDELENLKEVLPQAVELLNTGGRIVVISFHSLEDRIVKNYFKGQEKEGKLKILTKKPVTPQEDEIKLNPRCRSAKLRAGEKI